MRSRFEIYCDLLRVGLLNIRYHARDSERCHAQSDHLHNIPELLRTFDNEDLHRFYWNVTRRSFIGQSKPEWLSQFHE